MRKWLLGGAAALASLVCVTSAHASAFDIFGIGARGTAMGGAMSATAGDYTALYYNVAGLTLERPGFGFGMMAAVDDVTIKLKPRPDGYDLPDLGTTSAAIPSKFRLNQRSDTEDIEDTYGIYVGAVTDLGIDDLRLGFLAFLPVNRVGLQSTHYPDEREQYFSNQLSFELLGDRSQRQVIMVGGAYRLTDWLSVGAGLSWLPDSAGTNSVYLDNATDQSDFDIVLDNDQGGRIAPQAGFILRPTDSLRMGLAYRGELFFSLAGRNEIQIRGFQDKGDDFPIGQEFEVVVNYTPHQFAFGTAYEGEDLTVSLDVTHALWEYYRNNQGERVKDFDNTFAFRLGAEYLMSPSFKLRSGVGYEPSPVPDQSGRTNYVDNDRLLLSLGAGHPLQFMGQDLELSWYVQLQHLLPRDTNKENDGTFPDCDSATTGLCDEIPDDTRDPVDGQPVPEYSGLQTGNPGFPGYQSFGDIISVGVDLKWTF